MELKEDGTKVRGGHYWMSAALINLGENASNEKKGKIIDGLEYYAEQYKECKRQTNPESVAHAFFGFLDKHIDDSLLKEDDDVAKKITCRKGCAHCCKIHVSILDDEAIYLVEWVQGE